MNKEIFKKLQDTVENFIDKNEELNTKIVSNKCLYKDIFKHFKERAKVIDKNNSEVVDYINSIQCADIINRVLYNGKNFANYTQFNGNIFYDFNKQGLFEVEIRCTTEEKGKQVFVKFEDFIDFCAALDKMNYNYIEQICKAVDYFEKDFINEVYNSFENICKDINKAKENQLAEQLRILAQTGLNIPPRNVTKYKITIEVVE